MWRTGLVGTATMSAAAGLDCRTEAARGGGVELLAALTASLQQLRKAAPAPVAVPEGARVHTFAPAVVLLSLRVGNAVANAVANTLQQPCHLTHAICVEESTGLLLNVFLAALGAERHTNAPPKQETLMRHPSKKHFFVSSSTVYAACMACSW